MIAIFTDETTAQALSDEINAWLTANRPRYDAPEGWGIQANSDSTKWAVQLPTDSGWSLPSEYSGCNQAETLPDNWWPEEQGA